MTYSPTVTCAADNLHLLRFAVENAPLPAAPPRQNRQVLPPLLIPEEDCQPAKAIVRLLENQRESTANSHDAPSHPCVSCVARGGTQARQWRLP